MRIAVIGSSGCGKSTLARRLSERLGLPAIELDALNWGAGWFNRSLEDPEDLIRRVDEAIAGEGWVCDGNYALALPRVLGRASDVIWLDYQRPLVMRRVIGRSIRRALSGEELWPGTGNREDWRRWLDREHPIRWAWDTHAARRRRYEALFADPMAAGPAMHRLRRPAEAATLIDCLANLGPRRPPALATGRAAGRR